MRRRCDGPGCRVIGIHHNFSSRPEAILTWISGSERHSVRRKSKFLPNGVHDDDALSPVSPHDMPMELTLFGDPSGSIEAGNADKDMSSEELGCVDVEVVQQGGSASPYVSGRPFQVCSGLTAARL